jgi:hypothetical protein
MLLPVIAQAFLVHPFFVATIVLHLGTSSPYEQSVSARVTCLVDFELKINEHFLL